MLKYFLASWSRFFPAENYGDSSPIPELRDYGLRCDYGDSLLVITVTVYEMR